MLQRKKEKILITGASGMLGRALVNEFRKAEARNEIITTDINIIPNSHSLKLDLASSEATQKIIEVAPNLVIHLAAYTDVDGCEVDPDTAFKVNAVGTKNVALACKELGIPMVYISTDYVFDGDKPTPYIEWDAPNPINIYGETKLAGEKWVTRLLNKYWIVRTSGLYGEGGKNFVNTIIEKAKTTREIKVVADQIGSPTYTKHLASAIIKLVNTELEAANFGIYHITNSGWTSWFEFAKAIIRGVQNFEPIQCNILPISSSALTRPAKRPKNWRLQNFIWGLTFGTPLPSWKEALNEYLKNNR